MKVEFYILDEALCFVDSDLLMKLSRSIRNKVHGKFVDIPCMPTKGILIDMAAFADIFGFSEEELFWIEDGSQYHTVMNIIVKQTHLELWLVFDTE